MNLGPRYDYADRVRARVERKVGNQFVCRRRPRDLRLPG